MFSMADQPQLASIVDSFFPNLDLGDVRRNDRFRIVVDAIAAKPGASLPDLFPIPSHYHACLNLFAAPECAHSLLLVSHRETVLDIKKKCTEPLLLIHDTTILDFSGHTTLYDDLGPIGNNHGRGFLAHHSLAVNPSNRMVLGLPSQILHVREIAPPDEKLAAKRARASRESLLWLRGIDEVGPSPSGCHWIDVADRGADIFEFLQPLTQRNRRFVIRSKYNRALGTGPSDEKSHELLHDHLRGLPATANWSLELPARTDKPARLVRLSGVAKTMTIRPPHVKSGNYDSVPLELQVVRVWEAHPAPGEKALEWLLLTNEPTDSAARIEQVAQWYSCRMQIEEFHKAQKSGVAVESFQVQSVKKLQSLVLVSSIVAVGMMNLRLAARDPEQQHRPATEFVPAEWVKILSCYQGVKATGWTVLKFWTELARVGGYQKNPSKHPPGWITLWRGWKQLHILIRYEIAKQKMS